MALLRSPVPGIYWWSRPILAAPREMEDDDG